MKFCLTTSDDFDKALEMSSPGDKIELSAGVHFTRGNWAHRGWGFGVNGVAITGAYSEPRSVLALRDPVMEVAGVRRPQNDVNILWLGAGCSVKNVDFDCSLPSNPEYRTGGLRFHGRFEVESCWIRGLRGSKEDQVEVFAISAQGDTGGSAVGYVKVSDCKPNSYVSGIFLGGTVATKIPSRAYNCNVELGGGNMFCYASNYYGNFWKCTGGGAEAFFHNDYGQTIGAILDSCSGSASEAAIRLIGTDKTVRELHAENCRFISKRGLVLWQYKEPVMTGAVSIVECTIEAEYAACAISPSASAVFVNCNLTDGAICQYRKGTQPPAFISKNGQQNIKWEETK